MNWNFIFQLLLLYLIFNIIVYFISDRMIFPISVSSYKGEKLPGEIQLKTQDGKTISALYIKNPEAHYTILVSHGNAEDLGTMLPFLQKMSEQGFSVFAYDYHGYGNSEGITTEKNTYLDILAAFHYLTTTLKIQPNQIILYGRSLGTGPTIELASRIKPAGVILESGMVTAYRVMTVFPILFLDKYRNNIKIQKITVPILFIYGTQDKIIPPWHSEQLFKLATTQQKYRYAIEKAGHNDTLLVGGNSYWETIKEFVNNINKKASDHKQA